MKSSVKGPFVVITKSDPGTSFANLDELSDESILFTTEEGNLISLEEKFGTTLPPDDLLGPEIVITFLDPNLEIVFKYLQQQTDSFIDFLSRYEPGSTAARPDPTKNRRFWIRYGIGNANKVPYKVALLRRFDILQDYKDTYKVKVTFTLESNQAYEIPSVLAGQGVGVLGNITPLDHTSASNANNGTSMNFFPEGSENSEQQRQYDLLRRKYRNLPNGTIPYLGIPAIGESVDNILGRMNITGLLEMMFQDFLTQTRGNGPLDIDESLPIIMLPSAINSKLVETINSSYTGQDSHNEEAAKLSAFTTIMQNAGFLVNREVVGWSQSVSDYPNPYDLIFSLGFMYDPSVSRLRVVKDLINSLLSEIGISHTAVDLKYLTLTDPFVCEKLADLMLDSGDGELFVTNSKSGSRSVGMRVRNIREQGILLLCDNHLTGIVNPTPDDIIQNYASTLVNQYKGSTPYNNFGESPQYSNLVQFIQSAESYIKDITSHFTHFIDDDEDAGDTFTFIPIGEVDSRRRIPQRLIEVYKVNYDSDKVLDFKILNKEKFPLLGAETSFKFIEDKMLTDPAAFLRTVNISPSDPLSDGDIDYILNEYVPSNIASENGPAVLVALGQATDIVGKVRSQVNSIARTAMQNIQGLFSDHNVDKATLAAYLGYLSRKHGIKKMVQIKIKPEYAKYAKGLTKFVLFKVRNQDFPLQPNKNLPGGNNITGIYQVKGVIHKLSGSDCSTTLNCTAVLVDSFLEESDYDNIEAIYNDYVGIGQVLEEPDA
jgi:hypothetical protein